MVVVSRNYFRRVIAVVAVGGVVAALLVGLGSRPALAASCHPYPDVSSSNSACANIAWLKGQEITKPADGKYHPSASVSRGAMTAFLFRLTHPGKVSPTCTSKPFPDVSTSNVFCGYIKWAAKNHVAAGYPDGSFGPGNAVTRGAMAAFLHRIAAPGQGSKKCSTSPFDDVSTSDTFCGVITWMSKTGVTAGIAGTNDYGTALPVTRQAMASFLHRMDNGPLALMGHYYVGSPTISSAYESDDEELGLWFVDNEWAYWGRPTKGAPTCTHVTSKAKPKDFPGEHWGCLRYHFDSVTNKLTVGPLKGTYNPGDYKHGQLEVNDYQLWQVHIPKAGTRFNASMKNIGWRGDCGFLFGCTTWTTYLAFDNKGKFVKSTSSITTWGGGSGPGSGWVTSFPPDERGTYQVLSDARIKLHYASGKTTVRTIAAQIDEQGRPDPADKTGAGGLILGRDVYWKSD